MHGKSVINIKGNSVHLWFNKFSEQEIAKLVLPKDKKGFDAKPEEFALLAAISRLAEENYLSLMRDIIWSGVLGHNFATDTIQAVSKKDISEMLATTSDSELSTIWVSYLQAMGVNIDNLEDKVEVSREDKKKAQ